MKVFNWVHRRFPPIHSCIAYPQENGHGKGIMGSKLDVEKHALLEHGVIVDMLNDWNDNGILAIGTLAIGPLDFNTTKCEIMNQVHDDDHVENNHDDDMHHEHEHEHEGDDYEASPLMKVALFSHELEKVEGDNICKNTQEIVEEDDNSANCDELKDKNDGQIKTRVTLADLFSEDSNHHLVNKFKNESSNDVATENIIIITKPNDFNSKPKHGLNEAKKFLKEELRPLKKLNQLMTRMMKKKIHPDMEMKDTQMETRTRNGNLGIPTNNHLYEPNDSPSLLLISDSMI